MLQAVYCAAEALYPTGSRARSRTGACMRRKIWASVTAGLLTAGVLTGFGCSGEKAATGASTAANGGSAGPSQVRSETIDHEACSESGKRVETLDTNGDGKVDIRRVYDGSVEICRVSDMNHDGKPDMFEYFDKTGQIRRREVDFDDNAVANLIEHYENGKLVSRELDTTNQGRLDTWDTFDPATGKIVKRERDSTNDGRIDQWWSYDGDKVTIAMDRNGDGLPDPESTVVMGDTGKEGGAPMATGVSPEGGATPPPPPPPPPGPAPMTNGSADAGADAGAKPKKGTK